MANAAYENLKGLNEEQCVILTGESGSGKTESAKLVVDYVTKISQWRRYNCLQPPQPPRCYRSTTSLGGSNRSVNNSNASSRSATPSHTPSTVAAGGGGRRIIRAHSTETEPVTALNYGSLKKCGHERKTVEFDLSTKYKSTENLINHQVMLQAVSPTITVPKCQLHFPSPAPSSSSTASTATTYHHRHHVTPGTMKKCPKHNPEAKSIMVKCDPPHFKRSTGDLHHQQQQPQGAILNPHCRVHAAKSTTMKVPKASTAATTTTQSILKLTTGTTACDTKESNVNLSRTKMAGTPPRPRRSKTPPPTLHVQPTSSSHLLLHHRHSHHGGSTVNVNVAAAAGAVSSSVTRTSLIRSARPKTAEEVELDVIAERVHQAEQFLNAMGHATTTRNANSSRFGKFFDIQIDFKGDIVGAHLTQCKYIIPSG